MLDYIIFYFVIGAVCLLILYIITRLDNSEEAKDLREINKLLEPESRNVTELIINKLILPAITLSLALILWPVAVAWIFKDRLDNWFYKDTAEPEPEVFKVKIEHLKEQVTIEHLEALETVRDPLKSAPEIPFGHLNTVWQEFMKKIQPEDELWSFVAEWSSQWGDVEQRKGYVIVRLNIPEDFLLTTIKTIESMDDEF